MSQELVERLTNILARFALWMGADDVAHGPLTLTENAALYVKQHIAPEIKRLLADERERVRDLCAFEACQICWNSRAHPDEHGPAYLETKSGPHKGHWIHKLIFGKRDFPCRCRADHLRQLDLTAPSSTEENQAGSR